MLKKISFILSFLIILMISCDLNTDTITRTYMGDGGNIIDNDIQIFDIDISDMGPIETVNSVRLNSLYHDNSSQLYVRIRSPEITSVYLVDDYGGATDYAYNNSYTFQDSGSDQFFIDASDEITSGIYAPLDELDDFSGEEINGRWQLLIMDNINDSGDYDGSLESWEMTITFKDETPESEE